MPSEPCERTPRSAAKYYEYFRKQRGADFGRKKSSPILRASWSYWPDSNRRPAALPSEPCERTPRSAAKYYEYFRKQRGADFGRKKSSPILRASWSYWPDSNRRPAALPSEPCERTPRSAAKYYEYFRKQRGADFGRKKSSPILRASWSYWPDSNRRPADYESAALPAEPQ